MVIYLRHPIHGTKTAISEEEANYDMRNGWQRYTHGALLTPKTIQPLVIAKVESSDDIHALRKEWADKFGKQPHHRKSVDTLRMELTNDNSAISH